VGEIFKANITCKVETAKIISELKTLFRSFKFNFDLDDIDNILRAEGFESTLLMTSPVIENGFKCLVLD
jgi:hypothetical protein